MKLGPALKVSLPHEVVAKDAFSQEYAHLTQVAEPGTMYVLYDTQLNDDLHNMSVIWTLTQVTSQGGC